MRHITERARKSPSGQVRAALHSPRGVRIVRVDKSGATTVESVTASEDVTREAIVAVDVQYTVKETNDRRNLVVPYYEIGEES